MLSDALSFEEAVRLFKQWRFWVEPGPQPHEDSDPGRGRLSHVRRVRGPLASTDRERDLACTLAEHRAAI